MSTLRTTDVWPTDITLNPAKDILTIAFDDGQTFELAAEYLRVCSPSAEVQGHSPDQRKTVGGKKSVQIMTIEPVGNYAVRLGFDDMHNTGIFSWQYLHEMGMERDERWATYLAELEEKGLSRE